MTNKTKRKQPKGVPGPDNPSKDYPHVGIHLGPFSKIDPKYTGKRTHKRSKGKRK